MSIIEILIELVISISICGMAAYFFLSVPMEERSVGEGDVDGDINKSENGNINGSNGGNYAQRGPPTLERSQKCEGAMWCNVLGRWVALLLLGGGSIDKDVWTDRIAYFVDKAARQLGESLRRKQERNGNDERDGVERTLRVRPEMIRLVRIDLSGGGPLSTVMHQHQQQQQQHQNHHHQQHQQQQQQSYGSAQQGGLVNGLHHARTSSDSLRVGGLFTDIPETSGVATSPLIGVVLPRIGPGGIVSLEAPYVPPTTTVHDNGIDSIPLVIPKVSNSLRCFAVPIIYEDQRFALQFACYFPLLFALPSTLNIPSDVLTLRCALSIRRVVFHGTLYAAFCGNKVELSFTSEPQFTALFDVSPVKRRQRQPPKQQQQQFYHQQQQQQFQQSPGNSAQVNIPVDMTTTLPPLAPIVGSGTASVTQRSREKLQEIVDLAVKRAIQSITYPCVLQGKMRSPDKTMNQSNELVTWTLEKASLPLHC